MTTIYTDHKVTYRLVILQVDILYHYRYQIWVSLYPVPRVDGSVVSSQLTTLREAVGEIVVSP